MANRTSIQSVLPVREIFLQRKLDDTINEKVSPECPVTHKTGKFYRKDDSGMVSQDDTYTARGGAKETTHGYSSSTYTIESYALEEVIDPDIYDDADDPIQGEIDCLGNIKDILMTNREKKFAALLTNASNFSGSTSSLTGDDRWDDPDSDPTNQFILACETIKKKGGKKPNAFIIGYEAANRLQFNAALASLLGSGERKIINRVILCQMFGAMGIDIPESNIYVSEAQFKDDVNDAEGQYIWGKDALFAYIDPKSTTKRDDTLIKTFVYKDGKKNNETGVYPSLIPTIKTRTAYAIMHYGMTLVNSKLGYLFKNVVS